MQIKTYRDSQILRAFLWTGKPEEFATAAAWSEVECTMSDSGVLTITYNPNAVQHALPNKHYIVQNVEGGFVNVTDRYHFERCYEEVRSLSDDGIFFYTTDSPGVYRTVKED